MKLYDALKFLKYYPYRLKFKVYSNRKGFQRLVIKLYQKQGNFNSLEDIDGALERFFPNVDPLYVEVEFKSRLDYVFIRVPLGNKKMEPKDIFEISFSRKPFTDEE